MSIYTYIFTFMCVCTVCITRTHMSSPTAASHISRRRSRNIQICTLTYVYTYTQTYFHQHKLLIHAQETDPHVHSHLKKLCSAHIKERGRKENVDDVMNTLVRPWLLNAFSGALNTSSLLWAWDQVRMIYFLLYTYV